MGADGPSLVAQSIEHALAQHELNSIEDWDQIMAQVSKELAETLPSQASGKTINLALNTLIHSSELVVEQIPKTRENEWKELYAVKKNGRPLYVIKVYQTKGPLFPSEFWGQWCAAKLVLPTTMVAQVENAGKITVDGEPYFFAMETYLAGTAFEGLRDETAFRRLGKSLKEFHTASTSSFGSLTYPFITDLDHVIKKGLTLLDASDRTWMRPIADELRIKVDSKSLPRSYVHGDPNFDNFLLQNDKVAFIDFEAAGMYINASKLGLATPAFDLIPLLDYIDDLQDPKLKEAFLEGYGPLPYDNDTLLYFRLVDTLGAVEWFSGAKKNMSSQRIHDVQKTIRTKLNRIQNTKFDSVIHSK